MYIYICICIYLHIYMHMYMYIQICIYIYSYKYVYIYIVCMYVYIYIHIVCMYVWMYIYSIVCIYIYAHGPPWSTQHMSPLQWEGYPKIHVSFTTSPRETSVWYQYVNLLCSFLYLDIEDDVGGISWGVCVWPHIYIILYIYYVYIDILCKWYWGLMDFDCKTWQPWILQHARLGHAVEEAMEVESWDLEPQIHLI